MAQGGFRLSLQDNYYVKMYVQSRKENAEYISRELTFRNVAGVIASFGTIEDLRHLDKYYEMEEEENKWEK